MVDDLKFEIDEDGEIAMFPPPIGCYKFRVEGVDEFIGKLQNLKRQFYGAKCPALAQRIVDQLGERMRANSGMMHGFRVHVSEESELGVDSFTWYEPAPPTHVAELQLPAWTLDVFDVFVDSLAKLGAERRHTGNLFKWPKSREMYMQMR